MERPRNLVLTSVLIFGLCLLPGFAQQQDEKPRQGGRKPVLIRADEPEKNAEEAFLPDPNEAKRHMEVGKYYFKRKNYKAAEERFKMAIRHMPIWPEPYERLVKALQKQKKIEAAVDVCELFLATNPDHKKASAFEKMKQGMLVAERR